MLYNSVIFNNFLAQEQKMSTFAGYVENKEIYVESEDTYVRGEKTLQKVACAAFFSGFYRQSGALRRIFVGICLCLGVGTS